MKRVRCPKCDNYITFDETQYQPGRTLVFQCHYCQKQFAIKTAQPAAQATDAMCGDTSHTEDAGEYGTLVVVPNVFHHRQELPLKPGVNRLGRYVKGTSINMPIETADPSVDTLHCTITVTRTAKGLRYILADASSNTGTFYNNTILSPTDRIILPPGAIITIGATTLILNPSTEEDA